MNDINYKKELIPIPVKIMYFLLGSSYFIYIPVSFFMSNSILFVQDICLITALMLTLFNEKAMRRIFAARLSLIILVFIYLFSVVIRLLIDIGSFDLKMFTTVRNLLFGIGVFVISSIWINTERRMNMVIKIILWGVILTAVYGLRQLFFGFMDFELNRLSLMGASLKEFETMGRMRITSSFGDPLTFSFFMMIGIFIYVIARQRKLIPFITKKTHPFGLIIIFLSLVFTLTRAPGLGLLCGIIFFCLFNLKITKSGLLKFVQYLSVSFLFIWALFWVGSSKVFADSDNSILVAINNGTESFLTLFQMFTMENDDPAMYFLVHQSKDARSKAWSEGIEFLVNHPQGGGLTDRSFYSFAIGDVGILSYGLQIGILGLFSMVLIYVTVALKSWFDLREISLKSFKREGYLFLSMWVAIFITGGVSTILDTSVIAIAIWTIGGILINQKRIYGHQLSKASTTY